MVWSLWCWGQRPEDKRLLISHCFGLIMRRLSQQDQLHSPVPLLQHKSHVLLHKKAEGGMDRGHEEKGAIPLVCALGAFQGNAVGPACFIANASLTCKGT